MWSKLGRRSFGGKTGIGRFSSKMGKQNSDARRAYAKWVALVLIA